MIVPLVAPIVLKRTKLTYNESKLLMWGVPTELNLCGELPWSEGAVQCLYSHGQQVNDVFLTGYERGWGLYLFIAFTLSQSNFPLFYMNYSPYVNFTEFS